MASVKKNPVEKTVRKKVTPKKKLPTEKKQTTNVEIQKQPQNTNFAKNSFFAVGRRKEAVARVYYFVSPQLEILVNKKPLAELFPHSLLQQIITTPLTVTGWNKGKWTVNVSGGGKKGQAESIRLGITRLLVAMDPNLRSQVKKLKLLTRDPRVKERKKYGLKRARRAPQWQKR